MGLHLIDWLIIAGYFATSAVIGILYTRRAGRSTEEFFLSGRNLPWWLAGTSMVATTFAADTPLAVTELVARHGIAGNWLWWNFLLGGTLTVFFFARLWRRAGIMTDIEFVALRYSGRPAGFLRVFRGIYVGIFLNCIIMGWVNLAMAAILEGMLGIPKENVFPAMAVALVLTGAYSAMSGLWGVALTDAFQFLLAMAGTIVLALIVLSLPQVGGIEGLTARLPSWTIAFTPTVGQTADEGASGGGLAMTIGAFLAYIGVQWWAAWYPGAEPGGGGYVAQRMMSAKNERHSFAATLWFTIAHYCVRPWPWILVGLASIILYPDLGPADRKLGYVFAMRDYLPVGVKGMLVAAFLAAYMSTIATQLNWGTSYVINDVIRGFLRPGEARERAAVTAGRIVTILLMALSLWVTTFMETIAGAWSFILEAGAGIGLVLILRWYWWRVNVWSEISALIIPLVCTAVIAIGNASAGWGLEFPMTLVVITGITTAGWLAVTFLTPPTDEKTLRDFYRRVRPGGIGWRRIAVSMTDVQADRGYPMLFASWGASVVMVYAALFGTGALIFGDLSRGMGLFGIALLAAGGIAFALRRIEA